MTVERHLEDCPNDYAFSCSSILQEPAGTHRRCGRPAFKIVVYGDNQIRIPYCQDCLKVLDIQEVK